MRRHHAFGNNTSRSHRDGCRNMFMTIVVVTTPSDKNITWAALCGLISKTLTFDI
jgi:hypothetical protein